MSTPTNGKPNGRDDVKPDARFNAVLSLLSLEYQTLRAEILARNGQRHQFLTIAGSAVALIVGFAPKDSWLPSQWAEWAAIGLVLAILIPGAIVWWRGGQWINTCSDRIAKIEAALNVELQAAYPGIDDGCKLKWESTQQATNPGRSTADQVSPSV